MKLNRWNGFGQIERNMIVMEIVVGLTSREVKRDTDCGHSQVRDWKHQIIDSETGVRLFLFSETVRILSGVRTRLSSLSYSHKEIGHPLQGFTTVGGLWHGR
jgi:hypothetical protein